MSDFALFLGKFLSGVPNGNPIASIAPSSRWLARATLRGIDWGRPRTLIELGAGTGPITRAIAERARPDCRVLVIERDPDFGQLLRERFGKRPPFEVVTADARDLGRILEQRGITRADHVISGLPTPSLPEDARRGLFRDIRAVLRPEGTFNQITELAWVYWPFYRRFFEHVDFIFEPRNLPPAGAYICRGLKRSEK